MRPLALARAALLLAALGAALAATRLLLTLGAPEAGEAPPLAVTLSVEPAEAPPGAECRLFVEIRNTGDAAWLIVEPADGLFLRFDEPGRIVVSQHFPEELLKDRAANPFAAAGGIPGTRRLEPGDEIAKTLRLRMRGAPPGPREIVYALGAGPADPGPEPPPGKAADPEARLEAFAAWQRRAESPPARLTLLSAPGGSSRPAAGR